MEDSRYLANVTDSWFTRARTRRQLLLLVLFGTGIASAILMNDTLAIVGTPLMLLLARQHRISPVPLLLALAFAITIGSVASPIGNPQNLLVALQMGRPFVDFIYHLTVPTVLSLFAAYFLLQWRYPEEFHDGKLTHAPTPIADKRLATLCKWSLGIILVMIAAKIGLAVFHAPVDFRLTYIALAGALPILLLSPKRTEIVRRIDWTTLVFFAAMFVLVESVWQTGAIQQLLAGHDVASTHVILTVSVLASQVLSNVPLTAIYLPLLSGAGTRALLALAVGSTLAGCLFILGAASNVIIIQNSEQRGGPTITFWEFAKVGVPLTVISLCIYWLFL